MPILSTAIILIVIGVALYLVNKKVPMDENIKTILNWVVISAVIIWLVKGFGLLKYLNF